MIIAAFFRGPFDGKSILLPTEEPWPRFVIPKFGTVDLEFYYLLAGQMTDQKWSYLFDDSFAGIA